MATPHVLAFPYAAAVGRDGVVFFKQYAEENRMPYQRMIRAMTVEYAKRHR